MIILTRENGVLAVKGGKVKGVKDMKTKIECVKVELDIWDIASLKADFDAGNLFFYHERLRKYFKIGREGLFFDMVLTGKTIYRIVETQVTLESELEGVSFSISIEGDDVVYYLGTSNELAISFYDIHKISEILKRHGK